MLSFPNGARLYTAVANLSTEMFLLVGFVNGETLCSMLWC